MTSSYSISLSPLGVLVLGMSRSGTSAVARMLAAAGFHAGAPADLVGPHASNPHGHYENWRVLRLHEEALTALDATWLDAPDGEHVAGLRAAFVPRVAQLVDQLADEARGHPLVIKDPRAGILTGLWDEQLSCRLIPLLVLRDPREIALSLHRREGTPIANGLAGWERHLRLLLTGLQGREVLVVQYGELIDDPGRAAGLVRELARRLPEPLAAAITPAAAPPAIDIGLRHADRRADLPALTPDQQQLWSWLQQLPPIGELDMPAALRPPPTPAAVRSLAAERRRSETADLRAHIAELERAGADIRAAAEIAHHARAEADRARAEADRARAEAELARTRSEALLAVMRSSHSWRLTQPLRAAGSLARRVGRRRASRTSR